MDDGKVSLIAASPQSDISRFIRLCHLPHRDGSDAEIGDAVSMEVDSARVLPAMDSVVKVSCVHAKPNFLLPWQRNMQYTTTSSGFVIGRRRVLTNAHSVEHYTQVKLKKRGSATTYLATVLAIGTECDIAMLTVDDDEFWHGLSPVEFREDLPALQEAVTVLGYPVGGGTISVTRGVVSRVEILTYVHGRTELLGLQIDAAINPGNSGGPVLNDRGECVGIAFQSINQGVDNIGYVIPMPIVLHFINDFQRNGRYTGFPILGVTWQNMENPDLRSAVGVPSYHSGVRIRSLASTAPDLMVLKPSDVILYIDEVEIGNDGSCPFRHGQRLDFSYLISRKYIGDTARIRVLRGSVVRDFDLTLECPNWSVPTHSNGIGRPPSYYIVGGFVFVVVSIPYLRSKFGDDYVNSYKMVPSKSDDEQIVAVSQVLAADINIGYEDIASSQVHAFNGKHVKNLKSLATMVESYHGEFLEFRMGDKMVFLNTKAAKAAIPDILATYCIPSVMSDDLK